MKVSSLLLALFCIAGIGQRVSAEPLPKAIKSAPCLKPPTIDGVFEADEWRDAKVYDFDMEMLSLNPPGKSSRACELRVMNSANSLYIGFRVPDLKVNNSLDPLDFDLATLAFCRGKELVTGDDRKLIAPGLYADKHFVVPNKDGDDKKKDGRGAVEHSKGVHSFEWAIPLDAGDTLDIQVKAGDTLRFNLAYFDSFKFDLKDTQAGSIFGGDLNKADTWGTLELAAKVAKDDGSAFKGPAWVSEFFKKQTGPAKRLRVEDSVLLPNLAKPAVKTLLSFTYRDTEGKEKEAKAAIYFPAAVRDDPKLRLPLYFVAGYETDDNAAMAFVRRGFTVISPRALEANPLIRTAAPDFARMHMARALSFVDDAHVLIGGGSAGGYMTLMVAAETFPIAVAMPDVPPVNWGYNAAYFFKQLEKLAPPKGETASKVPVLNSVGSMLLAATKVFGDDFGDATWYAHSPVSQVSTITCPVSVWWTTADVLVPVDQVAKKFVKEFAASKFPTGFTMDPEKLLTTKQGRTRLMDVLPPNDYDLFERTVPEGTLKLGAPPGTGKPYTAEMPLSATKQWSIVILDEGPPEPNVGHAKYAVILNRDKAIDHFAKTSKIAVTQLTPEKLARLMDRYAGKEWLPSKLKQLDEPESEKADVLRGLRTYVKAGEEHAKQFAELYGKLPKEKRVLEATVVSELGGR